MDPKTVQACQEAGMRVIPLFDGVCCELPPRAPQRVVGIVMTIGGLFLTLFMLAWMAGPLSLAARGSGPMRWGLVVFGLLGLPVLLIGIGLTIAGNAVGRGQSRTSVEISGGRIRITEHFGPWRWSWKRPLRAVRRIRMEQAEASAGLSGTRVAPSWLNATLLKAEGAGSPLWIAPLYPPAMLTPLADLLTQVAAQAGVRIRNTLATEDDAAIELEPPPKTRVTIREYGEGFAIDAPPAGLIKGTHGLFFFSLIWLALCAGMFVVVPLSTDGAFSGGLLIFALFGLLFIGVGLAILGAAIHMGRRRTMLAANPKVFGLRQISPFGTQERRIPLEEIAAIRMGPSGMKVNDRPVMELQIYLRGAGEKIGCLSQLTEEELEWIAAVLRRRLKIGSGTAE